MSPPEKKSAKRPGPRPQGPYADKRKTLTTRITERTRARLDEAAAVSDRSLSQEIEFRLERSFLDEDGLNREFGGADNYRVSKLLFAVVPIIEAGTGRSWREHGPTFNQVASAWATILEVLRSQASKSLGGLFGVGDASIGREKAIALMEQQIEDLVRRPSKSEALARALMKDAPAPKEKKK
jgi:hypothetical protein